MKPPNDLNKRPDKQLEEIDEIIEVVEDTFEEQLPREDVDKVVVTLEKIKEIPDKTESNDLINKKLSFLPLNLLALLIKLLEKIGVI